jgi:hypothetical protein
MDLKAGMLSNSHSDASERGDPSIPLTIIVLTVLAFIAYMFIEYAIPVISDVICDFSDQCLDTARGLSR